MAIWCQRVHDWVFGSGRIKNSSTVSANYRTDGIYLNAAGPSGVPSQPQTPTTGMTYKGTYAHTTKYNYQDVVRVTSGPSMGVWVCVRQAGNQDAQTGTIFDPTWPEPQMSGGTNAWELLSFMPVGFLACVNNASTAKYYDSQNL